ncbi:MAG TPA: hypothetical protein VGE21_00970 [Flavobacteriales bacterium]
MEELAMITGWVGAVLLLCGYFLTVVKDWRVESGRYLLLSVSAAVLLCINAWINGAYPFVVINAAIILVAVGTVCSKGWPVWR